MELRARLTTIWGEHLDSVYDHQGIEVVWPLNDSRTAKVSLSIYDPILRFVKPVETLLNITLGPYLLFYGFITQPVWDAAAGTVEVNAHDVTLKLKHHFHRFGDVVVDIGYPLDGKGMRQLIESSIPNERQLARGVVPNGILWGSMTGTFQGPQPTTDTPLETDGLWGKAERGSVVWDTLTNLAQSVVGPDFEFQPIDEFHQPLVSEGFIPGYIAQLNTADRLGGFKEDELLFQYGHGVDNLENFVYQPDGNEMWNYWAEVNPGGQRGRTDLNRALRHDEASWLKYGIFGRMESAKQTYDVSVLGDRAKAMVQAYAYPPDFFQIDPRPDDPSVPKLIEDYQPGDRIKASVKKGYLSQELIGRIISATVTQRDTAGGANVSLDCVPSILVDAQDGDEGLS